MAIIENLFILIESGGLPFLFLLVLLEGNPFLGSFIPGQIIIIFLGALISSYGLFDLKIAILVVFLGAFIGDIIGFYLGKKLGFKGLSKFGIDENNSLYQSSYRFFEKYGSWSIFLGREFNLTRAFMPFLAGSFGMNWFRFLIISFVSCLFWASFSLYLGYYFGFLLVDNFNFFLEFVIFVLIYFLLIYFVYNGLNKYYSQNHFYLRSYAIHNLIFLGFLSSVFVVMYFLVKWGYFLMFNDYFSFIFFVSLYSYFGFIISSLFLFLMYFIIIFLFFYKKNYKMVIVYLWSIAFISILFIIVNTFMSRSLNVELNFYIIVFTLFIFYFGILIDLFIDNKKHSKYYNIFLVVFLFFTLLVSFSYTANFYMVIFSFLIAVIGCEFIWLFSYYQILDRCLYDCKSR